MQPVSGAAGVPAPLPAESGLVARFVQWRAAAGRAGPEVTQDDVLAYLESAQPSGRTAARWVAAISAACRAAGYPDPCTGPVRAWVRRRGNPGTRHALPPSDVAALAARIPVTGWPAGLRGRRDRLAFVLHQLAAIPAAALAALPASALSVPRARAVDVELPGGTVPVPSPDDTPAACPACAAVLWSRVLHHAADRHRPALERLLRSQPPEPGVHACTSKPEPWHDDWPLFPAIDQWGHFALSPVPPMSLRSMKSLLHDAAAGCGRYREAPARRPPAPRRSRPAVPDPSPPAPAPDPDWYRKGVAAKTRGQRIMRDAGGRLDEFYSAVEMLEEQSRRILEQATGDDTR